MARIGNNPNKSMHKVEIPSVVAGVITYLPSMNGYHGKRLEVVKTSLLSMRENAGTKCSIMVWDNGSCKELIDWLQNEYKPDTLILSKNVGKNNAKTAMARMLRSETILGIADDDIYYYPGWLKESIKLLVGFPNVGVVSAYPVTTQFRWGCENTKKWAYENGKVLEGKLIPEQWSKDFCSSVGREYKALKEHEYAVEYKGMKAYLTAHHCQFIGYSGILQRFPDWREYALNPESPFDKAIDNAGYLRLTTFDRLSRHIGNVIDEDIKLDWNSRHTGGGY